MIHRLVGWQISIPWNTSPDVWEDLGKTGWAATPKHKKHVRPKCYCRPAWNPKFDVLDTELPLSPTRTTSNISHTHSPVWVTSARTWQPGMRLDAATSRCTRLGFVDSGGRQWLTVGGTSRKLCTDRCMTMCIRKLLGLRKELRNPS